MEITSIIRKLVFHCLLYVLLWDTASASEQVFRRAHLRGVAGESGHMYVIPPGVYFHPIYNDVNGATDKHLTASMKLGVLREWKETSLEVTAYWRLITPSIREHNFTDTRFAPKGRFADWRELDAAYAKSFNWGSSLYVFQVEMGINHIGDKGGKTLHRNFHKLIGSGLENLEYTNTPDGYFGTYGLSFGRARNLRKSLFHTASHFAGIQFRDTKMMRELAMNHHLHVTIKPRWWELNFEFRVVAQLNSEVYDDLKGARYEAAAASLLYEWFTPTLRYVSPYFEGESTGQTYFDLLHVNYRF